MKDMPVKDLVKEVAKMLVGQVHISVLIFTPVYVHSKYADLRWNSSPFVSTWGHFTYNWLPWVLSTYSCKITKWKSLHQSGVKVCIYTFYKKSNSLFLVDNLCSYLLSDIICIFLFLTFPSLKLCLFDIFQYLHCSWWSERQSLWTWTWMGWWR